MLTDSFCELHEQVNECSISGGQPGASEEQPFSWIHSSIISWQINKRSSSKRELLNFSHAVSSSCNSDVRLACYVAFFDRFFVRFVKFFRIFKVPDLKRKNDSRSRFQKCFIWKWIFKRKSYIDCWWISNRFVFLPEVMAEDLCTTLTVLICEADHWDLWKFSHSKDTEIKNFSFYYKLDFDDGTRLFACGENSQGAEIKPTIVSWKQTDVALTSEMTSLMAMFANFSGDVTIRSYNDSTKNCGCGSTGLQLFHKIIQPHVSLAFYKLSWILQTVNFFQWS